MCLQLVRFGRIRFSGLGEEVVLVDLKFPEPRNVLSYELFLFICNLMGS